MLAIILLLSGVVGSMRSRRRGRSRAVPGPRSNRCQMEPGGLLSGREGMRHGAEACARACTAPHRKIPRSTSYWRLRRQGSARWQCQPACATAYQLHTWCLIRPGPRTPLEVSGSQRSPKSCCDRGAAATHWLGMPSGSRSPSHRPRHQAPCKDPFSCCRPVESQRCLSDSNRGEHSHLPAPQKHLHLHFSNRRLDVPSRTYYCT